MQDLEVIVATAKSNYDSSRSDQKCSKWLAKISDRICFYGKIMDVLSQHHPEYVSLAWGAMKLMFIVSPN